MRRAHPAEVVLALALAGSMAAWAGFLLHRGPAARHPLPSARLLAAFDLDGSGFLEADELDGRDPPGQSWTLHDLDGDGRLDVRELEVAAESLDPRWLLQTPRYGSP